MTQTTLALLPLGIMIVLSIYWIASNSKTSVQIFKETISVLSWLNIVVAFIVSLSIVWVGTIHHEVAAVNGLGFTIRIDALSAIMYSMISIIGMVVVKFSLNYLDGDKRQSVFLGRLALALASVQLLVLSGNIFQLLVSWVITSLALHQLLVFYRNRAGAIVAARKKFIVARLGDIFLTLGVVYTYQLFHTGDLALIFDKITLNQYAGSIEIIGIFIALAAILKSAQFPTQGWLVRVVETPTPVSALLHAGLLNAGPFLLMRMSHLITATNVTPSVLIIVGGLTAIFGSLVYLTQTSVKVALGYSSIAHMGFSILSCGLGVYSAAMLHLVAHSFYKAHAFLSSGSAIEIIRAKRITLPRRKGSVLGIVISLSLAVMSFAFVASLFGYSFQHEFGLTVIGGVILMATAYLIQQLIDNKTKLSNMVIGTLLSIFVITSFFMFEKGIHAILEGSLPIVGKPTPAVLAATYIIGTLLTLVIVLQMLSPTLKESIFFYKLGIHIRNGLYANAVFDRLIGSLKKDHFKWAKLQLEDSLEPQERLTQKQQQLAEVLQ